MLILGRFASLDKLAACRTRDYKKEYARDHATPRAKRHRAMRNKWNRRLKGQVPAGYEIDHIKQLRHGGGNDESNIRLMRVSQNRSEHNREKTAGKKIEIDREKVRDYISSARTLVGAGVGGGLGLLLPGKAKPFGAVGGALLGGALGRRRVSDDSVDQFINKTRLRDADYRMSDFDLAARGVGAHGMKEEHARLQKMFRKEASWLGKYAGVATKRDPAKWEQAKRDAVAKMGGKHSARAMQLATKLYKDRGGEYAGKKPAPSKNKLRKWTKQKWQWSGGDKGVYLPRRSAAALKSTESGREKLQRAVAHKRAATAHGEQYAQHGLHVGKRRGEIR